MNLPYLTGRCSLQPSSLITLTAITMGLCAGEGSVQGSCSLHPLLLPEKEKFTITQFCGIPISYLVRKPLLRRGTTPQNEKVLFSQDDGCCSQDKQMAWRSEGVSGLWWCLVWDVTSRLCAGDL